MAFDEYRENEWNGSSMSFKELTFKTVKREEIAKWLSWTGTNIYTESLILAQDERWRRA